MSFKVATLVVRMYEHVNGPELSLGYEPLVTKYDELASRIEPILSDYQMNPDHAGFLGCQTTPDIPISENNFIRFTSYKPEETYSPSIMCQRLAYAKQSTVTFLSPVETIHVRRDHLDKPGTGNQLNAIERNLDFTISLVNGLSPRQAKDLHFRLDFIKGMPGYDRLSEFERQLLELREN